MSLFSSVSNPWLRFALRILSLFHSLTQSLDNLPPPFPYTLQHLFALFPYLDKFPLYRPSLWFFVACHSSHYSTSLTILL
jgi:hypothetical protein